MPKTVTAAASRPDPRVPCGRESRAMREPDPNKPGDSECRDGERREKAGTWVLIQSSADQDDVQLDNDEERDTAEPNASRVSEPSAVLSRWHCGREHAGGSL